MKKVREATEEEKKGLKEYIKSELKLSCNCREDHQSRPKISKNIRKIKEEKNGAI